MHTSHHAQTHVFSRRRVGLRRAILLLAFAGLLAGTSAAQTRPVEVPPPEETDFNTLSTWVASNPGHTAVADQLDRLIGMAATMDEVRRIASEVLPLVTRRDVLAEAAYELARVTMTARDYAWASDLAETAYIAGGGNDLHTLFLQSQALLQTGEIAAAEQRARIVVDRTADYELKRRAYALVARAMHATGRPAEAARLLETLASLDDAALVEPDTLLLQSVVYAGTGESVSGPIEQLERLHPSSVAMRLVRGELVRQAPLPSALIAALPTGVQAPVDPGPTREPSASDQPGPRPEALPIRGEADAPAVSAIQVGSFSDPDNARHLARDLRELELDVVVETVDRNGLSLELVLVTVPGGTSASASRVLGVLREAGYDGFLIY